jgi:endonuclease/exonuclease/phosphatase family metal-dependent hydrolase
MDVAGVRKVAAALDYCWVYYPATLHPQSERQFGNAILSRYPIREDHKVTLPHIGQFGRTQRLATAATIDLNGRRVRVYSMHLATIVELGPERRRRQARAIVEDAARFDGPVLVGGDLNARGLGDIFVAAGFDWLTRDIGRTTKFASLDHFFVKGLRPASGIPVGKIADARGASDHVPVWTRVTLVGS